MSFSQFCTLSDIACPLSAWFFCLYRNMIFLYLKLSNVHLRQEFHIPCQSVQLMSALKSGEVANVRMASIIQQRQRENSKIPVDRSGGGL